MTTDPFPLGFFGKWPKAGDFVSRRLPRAFLEFWDSWLQSAMRCSQEQLGSQWLPHYLVAPIWRFALSPGVCGSTAWAGVLMPSVDRVGRYFPLALAGPIDERVVPHLFAENYGSGWFDCLEEIVLKVLDDNFDVEVFDTKLRALHLNDHLPKSIQYVDGITGVNGRQRVAFQFHLNGAGPHEPEFISLAHGLARHFMPAHSYWSTAGSDELAPNFLVVEGMLPIECFSGLMTGEWSKENWRLYTHRWVDLEDDTLPKTWQSDETEPEQIPTSDIVMIVPQSYGVSVTGQRRKHNEDAILDRPDIGMWVVADGMGGHQAGEVASGMIVDELAKLEPPNDIDDYAELVSGCLNRINDDLVELAHRNDEDQIIGSTVVVLLNQGAQCRFVWAGDSRLYRYRDGTLEQLTTDHCAGEVGDSTPFSAAQKNVITKAVGASPRLELDHGQCLAKSDDLYLLASDGLDKEVSPSELWDMCRHEDPKVIVESLIACAEARGARDNVSVVAVRIQ